MRIDGSLANNLAAAVKSARRLRGAPVHADTIAYWQALLDHARGSDVADAEGVEDLAGDLEAELQAREG